MRKRLSGRLLAVILTLAICATTVLGCLMTVSAAESCYTFGKASFPSEDDLTQATIDVTFTANDKLPNGFAAGQFTLTEVDADAEDYLTVKSVTAVTEGVNLVNEGNFYIFDGAGYQSVTLRLTFGFSKGEASKTGKEYKVKLTDVELYDSDDAYFVQDDANGAVGIISAGCKHSVAPVGTPIAFDTEKGYSVYAQSVCTLCGEQFGYQLVPTAEALSDDAMGTIDLLEFGSYLTEAGSTSNYYDSVVADNGETGADWDNAIIIDSAEEFVYLAKASGDDTAGKYYKVADGIAGFDLSKGDLNLNGTLAENLDKIKAGGKNHAGGTPGFQGHFDGNGATVYGAWTNHNSVTTYAGLFGCTKGNVTIKNINVKLSYFVGKNAAGGIVGYHSGDGTNSLIIENCSVTDTYIETQGTNWGCGVGAIVGHEANLSSWKEADKGVDGNGDGDTADTIYVNGTFNITNCYVNLDPTYFVSTSASTNVAIRGGLVGWCTTNAMKADKCVVIGVTPYSTNQSATDNNVQHVGLESHFTNIYTDTGATQAAIGGTLGTRNFTNKIFVLTNANMKGSAAVVNMPNLAWGTTWIMDGTNTYPRLAVPGEKFDTIYWDGSNTKTAPTVGSGTKDDPFIISTIAEFAYITGQARDNYAITDGKYYKIADGIKNIVMQPYAYGNDIMALDSAAEVKSYYETNAASLKQWLYYGWEGSTFCGNIDFNGATVYGIYQVSTNNAGLISNVDGNAVISNLTIKNSYMVSQSSGANYQVGAIVANTNATSYGKATVGFVWFNNCTVANNYLYGNSTSHDRSAVIIGSSSDVVYIDNCLVYGNDATYGSGVTMGIWSSATNNLLVSSNPAIPEGLVTVTDGATEARYYNMVRNSIILGAKPYDIGQGRGSRFNDPKCYENVYTDANVATDTLGGTTNVLGATDAQIKTISVADAMGAAAQTAMPGLGWNVSWYCGAEGELPSQAAFVTIGVAESSNPDFKILGTNIVYEDDGSFSMNIHYIPAYENFTPTLYVGNKDCTKLYVLDSPVASSKRAEIGDDTAMMFTLEGISAKNIDASWYPTLVATVGPQLNWSQSAEISVADTASAIIAGDYNAADKNVAAAVLNYGNASKVALNTAQDENAAGIIDNLEFGDYLVEAGSTSKYYDTNIADNGETGDSWDDPIIIDSAEEMVFISKVGGDVTKDKYFKVADGISGFYLASTGIDINKSLASNFNAVSNNGNNHSGSDPGFQGHFDGNGATIYGVWINGSTYAGLFSYTKGDVTIKNVNVKLSYIKGTNTAGGIIGYHKADDMCTVTVENCSVTDTYLEVTKTGYSNAVGAIIGYGASAPSWKEADRGVDGNGDGDMVDTIYINVAYNIKNCYVNLDEQYFVSKAEDGVEDSGERVCHGGVAGVLGSNALSVSNCVVIGITPYATSESTAYNDVQHSGLESHFTNIYTTAATGKINIAGTAAMQNRDFTGKVFQLTKEQMTGAAAKENMPALNWDTVWTVTDGYPTFISTNYKSTASRTIYYTGTAATIGKVAPSQGSGTEDDPYIINTVEELAYVAGQTPANIANVQGKYFKVADGISAIVLQKADYVDDILALNSAAETKAYFEANKANMVYWPNYGWEGSTFNGNIDFNGATVYGLFQESSNNAGLFSTIEAGAVISNLGIRNSYITSTSTSYNVGAIAAYTNGPSYAAKLNGVIWVKNATVANNYIYGAHDTTGDNNRVGVAYGSVSDTIYTDNVLVYGNDATYGAGYKAPFMASAGNAIPETVEVPDGLVVKYTGTNSSGQKLHTNVIRNSIILGCTPYDLSQGNGSRFNDLNNCYENIYTDADFANDKFSNGTAASTIKNTTYVADYSTLKGDAAQAIVDTFNANFGSTVWYVGASNDYPGFKPSTGLSVGLQAIYDGITLKADDYADSDPALFGMYATSLNLSSNPYISFAFAFNGEYKTNRDKITVKFTYIVDGEEVTKEVAVPAFEGDGTINNVNGWYNRPSSGRFHTYRFTDIPVEALASDIKVSASYDGGEYVNFGTFSVAGLGYEFDIANKQTPSDYYATRVEAVKALLFYTQMIQARYGA